MAQKLIHRPPSRLIKALDTNSDVLLRLTADFKYQLSQYRIVSFYEQRPMGLLASLVWRMFDLLITQLKKLTRCRLSRSTQRCSKSTTRIRFPSTQTTARSVSLRKKTTILLRRHTRELSGSGKRHDRRAQLRQVCRHKSDCCIADQTFMMMMTCISEQLSSLLPATKGARAKRSGGTAKEEYAGSGPSRYTLVNGELSNLL